MSIFKTMRLGLLHIAVAVTFVAINGVLNRVMIHELGILSTIVAILVILPYAFSPVQMWIGQYSDTHPFMGYRRTPYILVGLILCIGGAMLTPRAALLMAENFSLGLGLGFAAFGLWGFGFNLAVVAYLSLASDLSPESQRSQTISVMWFMMIAGLIATAIILGKSLEPYSPEQLVSVFDTACLIALGIGMVALVGLEPRITQTPDQVQTRESQSAAIQAVLSNPQARIFFIYLILMLAAILGQDILLEPFGAHAFNMTVEETTQLTATWGSMTLLSLLLYGFILNRFMDKKTGALIGGVIAMFGLLTIALSGILSNEAMFVPGIAILGFGTGIATATNLALMLDMTTSEQAGLFIGAWGVADALSRGVGMLMGGTVRDIVAALTGNLSTGYITVFIIEAGFLLTSLVILQRINVTKFRETQPTLSELTSLMGDA